MTISISNIAVTSKDTAFRRPALFWVLTDTFKPFTAPQHVVITLRSHIPDERPTPPTKPVVSTLFVSESEPQNIDDGCDVDMYVESSVIAVILNIP